MNYNFLDNLCMFTWNAFIYYLSLCMFKSIPSSDKELASLLHRQQVLRELELQRWKEVIDLTVKMVDQVR